MVIRFWEGNFDHRIVDYLADEFKKENGIDLGEDNLALQRLKEAGEKPRLNFQAQSKQR